jgi:hypothetical protein
MFLPPVHCLETCMLCAPWLSHEPSCLTLSLTMSSRTRGEMPRFRTSLTQISGPPAGGRQGSYSNRGCYSPLKLHIRGHTYDSREWSWRYLHTQPVTKRPAPRHHTITLLLPHPPAKPTLTGLNSDTMHCSSSWGFSRPDSVSACDHMRFIPVDQVMLKICMHVQESQATKSSQALGNKHCSIIPGN